jgi:hypothetical protein
VKNQFLRLIAQEPSPPSLRSANLQTAGTGQLFQSLSRQPETVVPSEEGCSSVATKEIAKPGDFTRKRARRREIPQKWAKMT